MARKWAAYETLAHRNNHFDISLLFRHWETIMKRYHLYWFPFLCLLGLSLTVIWLTGGDVNRTSYWSIQVDWFASISETLLPWRVFFQNITQLGDALIFLPIISFLIVWRPQIWAGFFGAIPLGIVLSAGGKYLAAIPRPGVVLDPAIYTAVGGMKGYHSFPSGHTITIFTIMAVILLVLIPTIQRRAQCSLFVCGLLIASFIAISRVAVGVHWPLDLVAGAALGYLAGMSGVMLTQRYQRWWHWLKEEDYQFIFGTIMLIWSFGLFRRVLIHSDNTDIVVWVAAILGLITSLYLLKNIVRHYLKDLMMPWST